MRRLRILLVALLAAACTGHQPTWDGGQFASPELIAREISPDLSFSPEDLYSNLLGIKLAGILVYDNAVGTTLLVQRGDEHRAAAPAAVTRCRAGRDGRGGRQDG